MEAGHTSAPEEGPKDLRCPFCLYHTKYKSNMIDHVVLHRGKILGFFQAWKSKCKDLKQTQLHLMCSPLILPLANMKYYTIVSLAFIQNIQNKTLNRNNLYESVCMSGACVVCVIPCVCMSVAYVVCVIPCVCMSVACVIWVIPCGLTWSLSADHLQNFKIFLNSHLHTCMLNVSSH